MLGFFRKLKENLMGGERETKVPKSQSQSTPTSLGDIRIHESGGEVHFHDDKSKLKVAVPVAEWWKEWQRLKTPSVSQQWDYIDSINSTLLSIVSEIDRDKSPPEISLKILIEKVKVADNFKKIQEFTKGSKK